MFDAATDDAIISSIRAGEYNLLLGAGVSLDATAGIGPAVPSVGELKADLCKLTGANPSSSLQRVFGNLTDRQIIDDVVPRFTNCTPGASLIPIPTYVWRRIFTFNIDDALESAYNLTGAMQSVTPIHYSEDYVEIRESIEVVAAHLHGMATHPEKGFVFSTAEYAKNIQSLNPWMTVLSQMLKSEPFIILGTSLDEVDLEYYLAHRTETGGRGDRGPSILVEPYPDAVTKSDCKRHGLILYEGTAEKFFAELDVMIPSRLSPMELEPVSTRKLFPAGAPKPVVASFCADFEVVDGNAKAASDPVRFLYGHPPTWNELAGGFDIGRPTARKLISAIESCFSKQGGGRRVFMALEAPGAGKTTAIRRVGFDLCSRGYVVLNCSVLGRIEPRNTAEALDLIDGPTVVLVDDFASQAGVILETINRIEKNDIVFLIAEREYRRSYIVKQYAGQDSILFDDLKLDPKQSGQLIDLYAKFGLIGDHRALAKRAQFSQQLAREEIAFACCRILNDFRPVDHIIKSLLAASDENSKKRFLIAALGQFCFPAGVRYEVLSDITGRQDWDLQFGSQHPLGLDYYYGSDKSYVVPLNATLSTRIVYWYSKENPEDMFDAFVDLAATISPYVNRGAIRRRSPEARLAGRLFDYDAVVKTLIGERSNEFYDAVQPSWQWNSRYWEQRALLRLDEFFHSPDSDRGQEALRLATQHARHAVAIENHAQPLTTLGKVLFTQMGRSSIPARDLFDEAFARLSSAIEFESKRARVNIQPFVSLFRGVRDYTELGGTIDGDRVEKVRSYVTLARKHYGRDPDMIEAIESIRAVIR